MKVMFIVYHDLKTEARSQEILECAIKLGKEVILVSYSKPFNIDKHCKYILTGKGKKKYFSFIMGAIKAIKKEKPDVVILHDNYTAILLSWLKKYCQNTYVVYDSSELYIDRKHKSLKTKIGGYMERLEKKYLKYADIVIAANIERAKIMKDYFELQELPIVFDNIHKIDDMYNTIECDERYKHLFERNTFNIVYGGGIAKQRLTFDLANVVGDLGKKYRLIVIGNSTTVDKTEFNLMLKEKGYSNIHYLGFISRSDLRYMFNKADISVSIFAQDTVNNINCASGKLYESLFEGTPILTSENPPLKRICEQYKVGVSTNNFKNGILELEKNYKMYQDNVEIYAKTLDVKARIDILAETLIEKMQLDNKK